MGPPGICIVGCGQIASAHAGRLRGKAGLWFQSRRRESAETLNGKSGGKGVFDSLDRALDDDRIDAVMITTPPETHADLAVSALEAGKAVFVEKPLCMNRAEIASIAEAESDLPVTVGENYYYKPSLKLIRQWLDDGAIGDLREIKVRKCFTQTSEGWKSAHGSLFEGGIHFVALIHGLLGSPPTVERVTFPTYAKDAPERNAVIQMTHGTINVELAYSWDTPSVTKGVLQHSSIVGDAGRIVFETNGIYARLAGRRSAVRFPGFSDMMGAGAMIEDFLEVIASGRKPVSDLEHARQDLETVFTAYEMGGLGSF